MRKEYAKHITKETKLLMKQRDQMKRYYQLDPDNKCDKEYKKLRNHIVQRQKNDRKEWANKIIGQNDFTDKKLWAAVKAITGKNKNNNIEFIKNERGQTNSDKEVADILAKHFKEKVTKLVEQTKDEESVLEEDLMRSMEGNEDDFEFREITMNELEYTMKGMKKSNSSGPDSINMKVMEDIFEEVKRALLHLINISLCTNKFPFIHKKAKILPILKPGKEKTDMGSYRPVANLNSVGKIIEKVCFDKIFDHISKHKLWHPNQHGSRKNHSTTTCLAEILEEVERAKENKLKVALIAIDMSSAYDLCRHSTILNRLRKMKIGPKAVEFVKSFLSERRIIVEVNGHQSNEVWMDEVGIVQGGSASGKLFTVYTNNLPDAAKKVEREQDEEHLTEVSEEYVDDLTIVAKATTTEGLQLEVQRIFHQVESYLTKLGMVINRDKTQLTVMTRNSEEKQIRIQAGNNIIYHQDEMRILGVTISCTMGFDGHIWKGNTNMIKSINVKSSMVKSLKQFVIPSKLAMIGNAVINSTISYAAPIWAGTTSKNIQMIQRAQIKAAKNLAGWKMNLGLNEHRQETLDRLQWPNVMQLVNSATLNMTKRAIVSESSDKINRYFLENQARNPRGNKGDYIKHRGRMSRNGKSLIERATVLFNNLNMELRDNNLSSKKFKMLLKKEGSKLWLLKRSVLTPRLYVDDDDEDEMAED